MPPLRKPIDYYQTFETSQYGVHQANQELRYSKRYGYDDPSQMLQDLGSDIHPVKHMLHTHDAVTVQLIDYSEDFSGPNCVYSPAETRSLRVATLLHDIGECEHPEIEDELGVIVGDVLYMQKSDSDESSEAKIRQWLYGRLYPELDDLLVASLESIIIHSQDDALSSTFNTIERLGYYETALMAGRVALRLLELGDTEGSRFLQLSRLATEVSEGHAQYLKEMPDQHEYVLKRLADTELEYANIHLHLK